MTVDEIKFNLTETTDGLGILKKKVSMIDDNLPKMCREMINFYMD